MHFRAPEHAQATHCARRSSGGLNIQSNITPEAQSGRLATVAVDFADAADLAAKIAEQEAKAAASAVDENGQVGKRTGHLLDPSKNAWKWWVGPWPWPTVRASAVAMARAT
jgi:hypothetical protein